MWNEFAYCIFWEWWCKLTENGTEYPVRIWLDKFSRQNYDDINKLNIVNPMGVPIEVSQFATIEKDNSPSFIRTKRPTTSRYLNCQCFGSSFWNSCRWSCSLCKNNPLPMALKWLGEAILKGKTTVSGIGFCTDNIIYSYLSHYGCFVW